jgi:serine/threonine-protein kinase
MASVWAAVDETNGRKLALKRLSKAANGKIVALFEREFHTLASLQSPCIVKAYDYAKDAEGPFYTMELLEGSDVSSMAPMPWTDVARVLRDVAAALTLLHARKVVHRDLSARNVWRTPDGKVKLIDFGTLATFGKPAEVVGTPPFIAPESLHSLELDQRTDLYALGALGYFLLTGRHAFPARSLQELEVVWREQPRAVSKRVAELGRGDLPEVPAPFEALLDALLSRDPLARPTTAADVIDRLTVIASLQPVEQDRVLDSYLHSAAFVGREPEREALRRALALALSGFRPHPASGRVRPGSARRWCRRPAGRGSEQSRYP